MRFLFLFIFIISCSQNKEPKINGVSFVSSGKKVAPEDVNPVKKLHANYAALMPFGFIENLNHPELGFNKDWQWFGERADGIKQYTDQLNKQQIQVMIKPQIWVKGGEFTGKIEMKSESDWIQFEKKYSEFILTFVEVAQEKKVPVFCIGTELELFVKNRPEYWKKLIKQIRNIYKGKLTYAANWDEYEKTTFWKELDYIGIDGYFPLSDEKTPTIDALKKGWQKHKSKMLKHSDSLNKKIVFTEFGYRSLDYAASKPWLVDYDKTSVNLQAQVNCTQVLFDELWKEDWFAGGFVWKWFIDHKKVGGEKNARFTPQNKPAENTIRSAYLKYSNL